MIDIEMHIVAKLEKLREQEKSFKYNEQAIYDTKGQIKAYEDILTRLRMLG